VCPPRAADDDESGLEGIQALAALLRLSRIVKLMRHYTDWRVMKVALRTAVRPIMIPAFAMGLTILLLAGALWIAEGHDKIGESPSGVDGPEDDKFVNAFETMWAIFWIVTTLGFDGYLGSGQPAGRLCIAIGLLAGLVFTTMPITIVGEAFREAWNKKEILEIEDRIRTLLSSRGLTANDISIVFEEFDETKDKKLDIAEFKSAMSVLGMDMPAAILT